MSIREHPLINKYKSRVIERINLHKQYLSDGKCKSYDEYKKYCGMIKGLNESLDAMDESIKVYLSDDEDD